MANNETVEQSDVVPGPSVSKEASRRSLNYLEFMEGLGRDAIEKRTSQDEKR